MDIAKELQEHKTVLLIIPSAGYNDVVIEIVKKLAEKNVGYVTLNKTFDSLKETFKNNKISVKNIVFVDAITQTVRQVPKETDGCYYVNSPAHLTELSLAIGRILNHNFDYLIFDSITNLLVYQDRATVTKFISSIINKSRDSNTKSVFYALSISEQETLIKECCMFVDQVIDLEKEKI